MSLHNQVFAKIASFRSCLMLALLGAVLATFGCDARPSNSASAAIPHTVSQPKTPLGTRLDLTIVGYNYTNRYIDDFSVNGHSGGNLNVAAPGSTGGGSVCCVIYFHTEGETKVKVRWQSGACYFSTKSTISTDTYQDLHSFYKEVEVAVDKSRARTPNYLEVHFYPDGSVKAAVTDKTSPPAMIVDKASEDRSTFPRCPNDKEPD